MSEDKAQNKSIVIGCWLLVSEVNQTLAALTPQMKIHLI
jgi:hypothetical protein